MHVSGKKYAYVALIIPIKINDTHDKMTSPLQQKLRVKGPVVVTANRLSDGVVIYRIESGGWSTSLENAQVLRTLETAQAALAAAQKDDLNAVGPYVADLDKTKTDPEPGNLREQIRVDGPTFTLPKDDTSAHLSA